MFYYSGDQLPLAKLLHCGNLYLYVISVDNGKVYSTSKGLWAPDGILTFSDYKYAIRNAAIISSLLPTTLIILTINESKYFAPGYI